MLILAVAPLSLASPGGATDPPINQLAQPSIDRLLTRVPVLRLPRAASTRDTRPLVTDQSTRPAHAHQ